MNVSLQINFNPFVLEGIEKAKASSSLNRNLPTLNTNTSSVKPPCVARRRAPLMIIPSSFLSITFAAIGSSYFQSRFVNDSLVVK